MYKMKSDDKTREQHLKIIEDLNKRIAEVKKCILLKYHITIKKIALGLM